MAAASLVVAAVAAVEAAGRLELSRVILRDIEKRAPGGTRFSMVERIECCSNFMSI